MLWQEDYFLQENMSVAIWCHTESLDGDNTGERGKDLRRIIQLRTFKDGQIYWDLDWTCI